ncbi:hypothetical protein [Saccharothrix deserti]|uniref:hypothetical protein n=1 Tax=Saccharothrix deserti TaxID=2593674 RepID=UPI0013907616|nr:hypothetical protein [Saccharothrix deserti]
MGVGADPALLAAVLDLFTRMKESEAGDGGWSGGDTVDVMSRWFAEFGIDVDADEVAAARSLRIPAWLAHTLAVPLPAESGLVIHVFSGFGMSHEPQPRQPRTHQAVASVTYLSRKCSVAYMMA